MFVKKGVTLILILFIFSTVIILCDNAFENEYIYVAKKYQNHVIQLRRHELIDVKKLHEKFKNSKIFDNGAIMFNETLMFFYEGSSVYNFLEQMSTYFVLGLDILINVIIPNGMIIYLFLCVIALIIYKYALLVLASTFVTLILNLILAIQYAVFINRVTPPLFNGTNSFTSSTVYTSSAYFRFKDSLLEVDPAALLLSEDAPGNRELRLVLAEFAIGLDNVLFIAFENGPYAIMIADSFICTIFHFGACGANFGFCELLFDEDDGFISRPLIELDNLYLEQILDFLPQIPDEWLSEIPKAMCQSIFLKIKGEKSCPCEACKLTGVTAEGFERVKDFLLDLGFDDSVPCDPFGQCCLISAIDYHYYDPNCIIRSGDWYTSLVYIFFPAQFLPGAGQFDLITPGYCTEHYLSVFELIGFLRSSKRTILIEEYDIYNLPELRCIDNPYISSAWWPKYYLPGVTYYDQFIAKNIQGLPFPFSVESVPAYSMSFGLTTGSIASHKYFADCDGRCTNLPNLCLEFNLDAIKDSSVEIQRDKSCAFLMTTTGYCFGESKIDDWDYRINPFSDSYQWDNYQNSRLVCPGGLKMRESVLDGNSEFLIQREYMCDIHYLVKWGLDSHWKSHWVYQSLTYIPTGFMFDPAFGYIEKENAQYILDFVMGDQYNPSPNISALCDIFFSAPSRTFTTWLGTFTTMEACLRDFQMVQDNGMIYPDVFPLNNTWPTFEPWKWNSHSGSSFRATSITYIIDLLYIFIPGISKHYTYVDELKELNDAMMESYGNEKYSFRRLIRNMTRLSEGLFNSSTKYNNYLNKFFLGTPKETVDYFLNNVNYLKHLGQNYDCDPYEYKEEFGVHFSAVRSIQRSTWLIGPFFSRFFYYINTGWTGFWNPTPPATIYDFYFIILQYIYDGDAFIPVPGEFFACDFEKDDERIRAYKLWRFFTDTDLQLQSNKFLDEMRPWIEDVLDPMGLTSESERNEVIFYILKASEIFRTNPTTSPYTTVLPNHQFYVNGTYIVGDYILDNYVFGGSTLLRPGYQDYIARVTDQYCYGEDYIIADTSSRVSQWPIYICSVYNMLADLDPRPGSGTYYNYDQTRFSRYPHLKYLLSPDYNTCEIIKMFFKENYNFGLGKKVLQSYESLIEFFDC
jgi:hypothetical protein